MAKKQGAKTDFRDALHLAQELRTNHLQPVFHDTSHWMEIRTTVSGYLDIVEEIVRFKNRLKAVFRAEAIQKDENSFYKNKTRIKGLKNPSAKFVAEKLFDQIEFLELEKDKYKEVFERNRKKYRPIRNLMTIPGISIIRANTIAAIVCQPARFENKHRFWGYCMLVRHIQETLSHLILYSRTQLFFNSHDIFPETGQRRALFCSLGRCIEIDLIGSFVTFKNTGRSLPISGK